MNKKQHILRILQVSTLDIVGGAGKVAYSLFQKYHELGHKSWLAVGYKRSSDPGVLPITNNSLWIKSWRYLYRKIQPLRGHIPGVRFLSQGLDFIAQPQKTIDQRMGREDFNFPGTKKLLELTAEKSDVVHCHNLHGGYFDLRELPEISRRVLVVLTLHDAWLLGGHCAHSFDCERWKTGCGKCPDLTIYPAIKKDATAYNWQRKKEIFKRSKLYIAAPSGWLMQKVEQSILYQAAVETRIIPNGVDFDVFHPAEKQEVREKLGIPLDVKVLLFTANGIRRSIWKDYKTMEAAVSNVAKSFKKQKILFIALGEDAPKERIGQAEIHFIPYQKDAKDVAFYYQAADVYVHAARAETFPNTVIEALACGLPVVATAVGGIPEQVEEGVTGFLTPPEDAESMASRIVQILEDDKLKQKMSVDAAESARKKFSIEKQVNEYLRWYGEIINK